MLTQAEDRLGHDPRCTLVQQVFEAPLPEGPFDAVVSALAIHHLEDDAKRDLYRRAAAALSPGGVFVNAEQVAGATAWVSEYQQARWREEAFAAGTSQADMAASDDRRRSDRCAPVADQLAWLREAGLVDADVFFLDRWFAVLAAWHP
jgi:tRNA (cmo5U34)-methyltransferase